MLHEASLMERPLAMVILPAYVEILMQAVQWVMLLVKNPVIIIVPCHRVIKVMEVLVVFSRARS